MAKRTTWVLLWVSLSLVSSASWAAAPTDSGTPGTKDEVCPGKGGDVPTPFSCANKRVELADGEKYILVGKIRTYGNTSYLEVDLDEHAWLATSRRQKSPYYPLAMPISFWKPWEGLRVKLLVEASGRVVFEPQGKTSYIIVLLPASEPVLHP
jgi:hypothetical protein